VSYRTAPAGKRASAAIRVISPRHHAALKISRWDEIPFSSPRPRESLPASVRAALRVRNRSLAFLSVANSGATSRANRRREDTAALNEGDSSEFGRDGWSEISISFHFPAAIPSRRLRAGGHFHPQ